jgi:hypothetical protein
MKGWRHALRAKQIAEFAAFLISKVLKDLKNIAGK